MKCRSSSQPSAQPLKALSKSSGSPLCSVETVNDGQFHSVELVMLNQTLNLVVDKGVPKSLGKPQKQPAVSINTPLYLGGKALLPATTPATSHLPSVIGHQQPGPLASVLLLLSQHPLPNQIREGSPEEVTTKLSINRSRGEEERREDRAPSGN